MPLAKNMVSGGLSGTQIQAINGAFINSAVTAAGTTQATATALVADGNVVTAGGADAGVKLYNGDISDSMWVFNNQNVNIKVYPPTGGKINQIATNGAHILAAQTTCWYTKVTSTTWAAIQSS